MGESTPTMVRGCGDDPDRSSHLPVSLLLGYFLLRKLNVWLDLREREREKPKGTPTR